MKHARAIASSTYLQLRTQLLLRALRGADLGPESSRSHGQNFSLLGRPPRAKAHAREGSLPRHLECWTRFSGAEILRTRPRLWSKAFWTLSMCFLALAALASRSFITTASFNF